jgi:hypothetical protein
MVHTQCKICEKNVFYTKEDFVKAHGEPKLAPSVWIQKRAIINKYPLVFSYKWVCRFCKKENHSEPSRKKLAKIFKLPS